MPQPVNPPVNTPHKSAPDLGKKEIEIENQVQRKILAQLEVLTSEVIGLRSDLAILFSNRINSEHKGQSQQREEN